MEPYLTQRSTRWTGGVATLVITTLVAAACATASARRAVTPASRGGATPVAAEVVSVPVLTLEDQWGVRVVGLRLTAAGYMLDFRYRVVDAEKAKPIFDRRTKPVLIDATTGARLVVPVPPKTGALRSSNTPIAGRTYFMFFANPGRFLKPGSRVTVVIGAFKAENLVVQ
jgi:hypothetical protein